MPGGRPSSVGSAATCTWYDMARAVMPTNIVTESTPIAASVVAAFFALGLRKAGTPLLMASTPVRAVHPEAKARIVRNTRASPV